MSRNFWAPLRGKILRLLRDEPLAAEQPPDARLQPLRRPSCGRHTRGPSQILGTLADLPRAAGPTSNAGCASPPTAARLTRRCRGAPDPQGRTLPWPCAPRRRPPTRSASVRLADITDATIQVAPDAVIRAEEARTGAPLRTDLPIVGIMGRRARVGFARRRRDVCPRSADRRRGDRRPESGARVHQGGRAASSVPVPIRRSAWTPICVPGQERPAVRSPSPIAPMATPVALTWEAQALVRPPGRGR